MKKHTDKIKKIFSSALETACWMIMVLGALDRNVALVIFAIWFYLIEFGIDIKETRNIFIKHEVKKHDD